MNAGVFSPTENAERSNNAFENVLSGDEADVDGEGRVGRRRSPRHDVHARDFENGSVDFENMSEKRKKHPKRHKHSKRSKSRQSSSSKKHEDAQKNLTLVPEYKENAKEHVDERPSTPQVNIVDPEESSMVGSPRRPFTIRNFSEAVHAGFNSTLFLIIKLQDDPLPYRFRTFAHHLSHVKLTRPTFAAQYQCLT